MRESRSLEILGELLSNWREVRCCIVDLRFNWDLVRLIGERERLRCVVGWGNLGGRMDWSLGLNSCCLR